MKKFLIMICFALISVCSVGCSAENSTKMYIETAQLTDEAKGITELLGIDKNYDIYDFKLDDNVKSININLYELVDGAWEKLSGGGYYAFDNSKGRIALGFDRIGDGMTIAIQSEDGVSSTIHDSDIENEDNLGLTTSKLSEKKEIVYEEEIPLAIQIATSKNEISSYVVDYFYQPEEYEKFDYEHVYAITVEFSQNTIE